MILWHSFENDSPLNPKFSNEQKAELLSWVTQAGSDLQGHVFLLSSGTTAQSTLDLKWVALSKAAVLASASAVNQHLESDSRDCWLHPLPEFHVGGLGIEARSYLSGASVVKLDGWSAERFVALIRESGATLTSLVPAQIYDLILGGWTAPPSIRAILVGGGALSLSLYQKALALGWPLLITYGMTETCSQVATSSLQSLAEHLVAQEISALPPLEVLSHLSVETNEAGFFRVRGESLFSAYIYWLNGKPVCVDPKVDGAFTTQDQGQVENGILRVKGRAGDFVKIGGESVEVARLQDIWTGIFVQAGLNADSTLLAVPDERLGHVIHLVTDQRVSAPQAESLVQEFNARVLGFEKIRKRHALEAIPRTPLGKLISAECLKKIASADFSSNF